jgi:hypothetical protein
VGTVDTEWLNWVIVSAMPSPVTFDDERAKFLESFNPDLIDWYGGLRFNRGDFVRSRGVAASSAEEYEYEESLEFTTSETLDLFEGDGVSRNEHNQTVGYGPDHSKQYMEVNAPKWKEMIVQGNVRASAYNDLVTQDNIGSPLNKAAANYDDYSNLWFRRYLAMKCAKHECSPVLLEVVQNTSFNFRDYLAKARAGKTNSSSVGGPLVMKACSGETHSWQVSYDAPDIQIESSGECVTSVGSSPKASGTLEATACLAADKSQQWTLESKTGRIVSARTDCAFHAPCCADVNGANPKPGARMDLFQCDPTTADDQTFHLVYPYPGVKIAYIVSNKTGLCVDVERAPSSNEALLHDPVVHEFIRNGYLSALQNWDDVAAAVRRAGRAISTGENRSVATTAVLGNQWGLVGTFPVSMMLSQISDVAWIEGPQGSLPYQGAGGGSVANAGGAKSAWSALGYKLGKASGSFTKPVWTIQYPNTPIRAAVQLAEGHTFGGLMVTAYSQDNHTKTWGAHQSHANWSSSVSQRPLFTDRRRLADVGLLYSLPSVFWRRFSSLDVGVHYSPSGFPALQYTGAVARLLEDQHVAYDTLILGHPDLFNDEMSMQRLGSFHYLVLAGGDAVSDVHVALVTKWVREGGGHLALVGDMNYTSSATGTVATRDEELKLRAGGTSAFAPLLANAGKGTVSQVSVLCTMLSIDSSAY